MDYQDNNLGPHAAPEAGYFAIGPEGMPPVVTIYYGCTSQHITYREALLAAKKIAETFTFQDLVGGQVMSNLKHTPGPWVWVKSKWGNYFELISEGGAGTTVIDDRSASGEYSPEIEVDGDGAADAALIAAAPDMLELLKLIKKRMDSDEGVDGGDLDVMSLAIGLAIKKAEGGAA